METNRTLLQKNWNISQELEQEFDEKTLKKNLRPFNQAYGGNHFFVDFYRKKVILDKPNHRVLCGYSREAREEHHFNFYKLILNKEDSNWLSQVWKHYEEFFLSVDENKRKDFNLLFDVNVKMNDETECVLHYKIIPYQLCDNGNLWLALVCVSPSLAKKGERNACILNLEVPKRYDITGDRCEEVHIETIAPDEYELLGMFMQGMSETEIRTCLGDIRRSKYNLLRKKLFKKLEVDSPAGAVQRAHQLGLI